MFDVQPGEFVMVKLQNYDYTAAKALEKVLYNQLEMSSRQDNFDYCATTDLIRIFLKSISGYHGENLP